MMQIIQSPTPLYCKNLSPNTYMITIILHGHRNQSKKPYHKQMKSMESQIKHVCIHMCNEKNITNVH